VHDQAVLAGDALSGIKELVDGVAAVAALASNASLLIVPMAPTPPPALKPTTQVIHALP
jgi:hypothetical protein